MSFRLYRATVLLGIAALAACAGNMSPEPAPEREWLVQCESALKPWPVDGASVSSAKPKGWIAAHTPGGEKIYLLGELEDGFVQVSDGRSADPEWALDNYAPYQQLRRLCRQTLFRRDGGESLRVGLVRTARNDEGAYTSFLFDHFADREPVTRLIIFGDSLSDTGRLKRSLKLVPKRPYWLGRFSNGPAWPDYLEITTSVAVQNHAVGGAMSSERVQVGSGELTERIFSNGQFFVSGSVRDQIDRYSEKYLHGGNLTAPQRTVAILWSGANDYISKEAFSDAIGALLRSPAPEAGYDAAVDSAISAMRGQLESLIELGFLHLVVLNLPDLGQTPMVLHNESYLASVGGATDEERRVELAQRFNALTTSHNSALAAMLTDLDAQYPQVDVVALDAGDILQRALNPATGTDRLGFDLSSLAVTLGSDSTDLEIQDRCYSGITLGVFANDRTVCEQASRAVFWDLVHPTTYLHCWIAYSIGQSLQVKGWLPPLRDATTYRNWCQLIADVY